LSKDGTLRQREDRVQEFLATLTTEEVLMLELHDAVLAGRIYADLERIGQPIGYPDSMIAAIALQRDQTLVTGNLSHYQRIQALGYPLRLDNWRT
jgi:predicted nucleic acid-binding protein